jgi:hypothetical protein
MIAFMALCCLFRVIRLDLGDFACNAALGFHDVIGVLEPQEGDKPNNLHSRRSVSHVMSRVPLTMASMRLPGTPIACASWFWLIPVSVQKFSLQNFTGMRVAKLVHNGTFRFR